MAKERKVIFIKWDDIVGDGMKKQRFIFASTCWSGLLAEK